MEYSPPPLFKQGASARAKVTLFALISVGLLVADARLQALAAIRQVVGTVLYPLQVVALAPRDAAYAVGDYFVSLSSLERENKELKLQHVANGQTLQQAQQLRAENAQLRRLLGASEQLPVKSLMSEILYDARDAFTRKIVLNRGSQHGVVPGQPVIDDIGVIGQVTRVFPFTSEVTLLTDKDQAIPVQVVRSGLRSVAYGRGQSGVLDLRFMPINADIKKGDVLVTSGIDGVYPAGLSVATVADVEHKSNDAFARILCQPSAGIDRNRQLLILLVDTTMQPRPAPEDLDKKDKFGKKRAYSAAKEPAVTPGTAATVPVTSGQAGTAAGAATAPVAAPAPAMPAAPKDATKTNTQRPATDPANAIKETGKEAVPTQGQSGGVKKTGPNAVAGTAPRAATGAVPAHAATKAPAAARATHAATLDTVPDQVGQKPAQAVAKPAARPAPAAAKPAVQIQEPTP